MAGSFICLGGTLSYRYIWEPQLKVGMVVSWDLMVPRTAELVDVEATRQAIEQMRQSLPLQYRLDPQANRQSWQRLNQLLEVGDRLRSQGGKLPFFSPRVVSFETQKLLRRATDLVLEQTLARARFDARAASSARPDLANRDRATWELAQLIAQGEYLSFREALTRARATYSLARTALEQELPPGAKHLLDLTEAEWLQAKDSMREAMSDILAGGLVPGLPAQLRINRIQNHRLLAFNRDRRTLAEIILDRSLVPNLVPDPQATAKMVSDLERSISPRLVTLKAGTVLVKAGERIGKREFAFLDSLGLTERRLNLRAIALVYLGVAAGIGGFAWIVSRYQRWLRIKLHLGDLATIAIVVLALVATAVILSANFGLEVLAFVPMATASMVVGSFYGNRVAAIASLGLVFWLWLGLEITALTYMPLVVGSLTAALFTNRPPSRSQVALIGIVVGGVQAFTYLVLAAFTGNLLGIAVIYYGTGGLIAAVVALGAIPYLEQLSYHPTPIRLAELANLDRPLLRRLVTEAPGTFQHTLFVANLAEEGARALGADTMLVRTGTLYHDVGKTLKPEYFIENQMGQPNPHDALDDPWHSAAIIKDHVSGGIKLAQKYRLPQILQAFIPEHQGTITISYFYHRAQQKLAEVDEQDFRYPGPIPQSRETAIVMLADACEAALRSLGHDTSLTEAVEMVNRIFRQRWDDGQLLDSGLGLAELEQLAPVFIRVWRQHNHGRIKYPELARKLDPAGSALPIASPLKAA
ncbi:MAG: HDIG domain-containing protein [Pseudanabaenaceae cyanobacterium bins.68]|nr:HDIG domain-containing protein [Pseudanabaenaceae cyanobacterium bins.68]